MTQIEEVIFEAMELGLKDQVFSRVNYMVNSDKYKYAGLNFIYDKALKKEKKILLENNLLNERDTKFYQERNKS